VKSETRLFFTKAGTHEHDTPDVSLLRHSRSANIIQLNRYVALTPSDCQDSPASDGRGLRHIDTLFAPVTLTLTLTRWPWYTNMTWRCWRHSRTPKMNLS